MHRSGFLEIETPMLTRSTPEGARDYLVPSRVHPGQFYALPQSPQIFKQILMISGMDRYFQIARCFRDEDLRADRQPEFTQLDLEMSFARPESVFAVIEPMLQAVWREIGRDIKTPFRRLRYSEAIARYGSDKPDLRFGLEIEDLSDLFRESDFRVFRQIVAEGGVVRGFVVPGGNRYTRSQLDALVDQAKQMGFSGLIWVRPGEPPLSSVKAVGEATWRQALQRTHASSGDLLLVAASWLLAYVVRFFVAGPAARHGIPPIGPYLLMLLPILIVWGMAFRGFDLYRPRRIGSRLSEVADVAKASLLQITQDYRVALVCAQLVHGEIEMGRQCFP